MFNILVVASTDNMLKFRPQFRNRGLNCDFLISESGALYDFGHFKAQHILANKQMTSVTEHEKYTLAKKLKKNLISAQLNQLYSLIYDAKSLVHRKNAPTQVQGFFASDKGSFNIFKSSDIVDFAYDKINKKMSLEVKNVGVHSYDHVLIENSDMTLQYMNNINPQMVDPAQTDHFLWAQVSYKLSQPLEAEKFWFVQDCNYQSLYDNWYFLNSKAQDLDVWTWVPAQQKSNQEYFSFFSKRILTRLEKEFDFVSASLVSEGFRFQPLNSGTSFKVTKNNLATLIPCFHFYSESETTQTIDKIFATIIGKLKVKKEQQTESRI